jgi:L,D-transpeptidase catalytic domain
MSCCSTHDVKRRVRRIVPVLAAMAAALFLGFTLPLAGAQKQRGVEIVQSRTPGTPIMAVVSLGAQRITAYDAEGWIMRAPVSSGRKGYETPAGIYAVIQKEAEHYSNLYEDGYMPFMQRITWSGIALHGGPLPGYPASHGCVRIPLEVAERLFEATKIGMRVIVARNDPVPVQFSHPFLSGFNAVRSSDPVAAPDASPAAGSAPPSAAKSRPSLREIATQKAAEAKAAAARADATRLESIKRTIHNSRITAALHLSEDAKARLEARAAVTKSALDAAVTPEAKQAAEAAHAKIVAKLAEVEARFDAATLAAQHRPDVLQAREEADAAETENSAAQQAAAEAARDAAPISMFISRTARTLYARQTFRPVFEMPITIRDPDQPIGTHVFTALDETRDGSGLRWNALSLDAIPALGATPGSALDRVTLPSELVARASELVSPGSSLIISDEGLSPETANDTDFIVIMSNEPQGGTKVRHHTPDAAHRYNGSYGTFFRH